MKPFWEIDIENEGNYIKLLSVVSKLSGLFSESTIPFINYRVIENIFCKSFQATNLSRSDTAFDANFNSIGVGLKTFICLSNNSNEKIAEFNSLSKELLGCQGKDLAQKLAYYRNERIDLAKRLYNITNSIYHIVARRNNELLLFETNYEKIDISNIHAVKQTNASLQFEDGKNWYSFNYSKSTLFRKFIIPDNTFRIPVEIIENPYSLLLQLFENKEFKYVEEKTTAGVDFVVLPLYGKKNNQKFIFEKSGLNQWNASGRKRDFGEIYIPIPAEIHRQFPDFFPKRDEYFSLEIPTGEIFSAKVCQDNSKALMTNPNKALSEWLLRKVFRLKEGELLTTEKMNTLGFDSVIITKTTTNYRIDKARLDSYENFIHKK